MNAEKQARGNSHEENGGSRAVRRDRDEHGHDACCGGKQGLPYAVFQRGYYAELPHDFYHQRVCRRGERHRHAGRVRQVRPGAALSG